MHGQNHFKFNIKVDFKDTGYGCVNWIYLAQTVAVEVLCKHGKETGGLTKYSEFLDHLVEYKLLKEKNLLGWG